MKKITHTRAKFLSPVTLYLDDINEIVNKIRSVHSEVEFATKDFVFDSLDELKEKKGYKLKDLSISGGMHNVSLDIRRLVYLHAFGGSEANSELWDKLKEFLKNKSGWLAKILNIKVWGIIFGIWLLISGIILEITKQRPEFYRLAKDIVTTSFFIIAFFLLVSLLVLLKGSTVYLEERHKVPGFWEKYRDNIIMMIVGGIITFFIQFLIKSVFK